MKIYNAERREFSIHISVKKFWSENFGQQSEGGKTPDDPDGHLQQSGHLRPSDFGRCWDRPLCKLPTMTKIMLQC